MKYNSVISPLMSKESLDELKASYKLIKPDIESRLNEFKERWANGSDEEIFAELAFCLLTPQSKATTCWSVVECLLEDDSLYLGGSEDILEHVKRVRFKNNKTGYILLARDLFTKNNKINIKKIISKFENPFEAREWLVDNVKGMGWKEASHFLRNIGMGDDLAILDRHILKNMAKFGAIKEVPN